MTRLVAASADDTFTTFVSGSRLYRYLPLVLGRSHSLLEYQKYQQAIQTASQQVSSQITTYQQCAAVVHDYFHRCVVCCVATSLRYVSMHFLKKKKEQTKTTTEYP